MKGKCSVTALFVFSICLNFMGSAQADLLLSLDAEEASIFTVDHQAPNYLTGYLEDNGYQFPLYEHGSWHDSPAFAGPNQLGEDNYAIVIEAHDGVTNDNSADRSEVCFIQQSNDLALRFGQKLYFQFRMKVDPISKSPENWMILHQVWQYTNSYSPPFEIGVQTNSDPDGPIVLVFKVRDDNSGRDGNEFGYHQIQKDRWYLITLQLQPSYNGDGKAGYLAVWIDKDPSKDDANPVWDRDWGYIPGTHQDGTFAGDSFDVRVGVYRRRQRRPFKVYYDDLKWAQSAADLKMIPTPTPCSKTTCSMFGEVECCDGYHCCRGIGRCYPDNMVCP